MIRTPPPVLSALLVREIVNPITRTPVKIRVKKDGVRETARVRVPGGYRQTWWPTSALS